jgi:hypothetical protein
MLLVTQCLDVCKHVIKPRGHSSGHIQRQQVQAAGTRYSWILLCQFVAYACNCCHFAAASSASISSPNGCETSCVLRPGFESIMLAPGSCSKLLTTSA